LAASKIDVYVEIGLKRTFAGAIDWPGLCRSGRDELTALQALLAYGSRYADVLRPVGIDFQAPGVEADLNLVERLAGTMTTDFGAPDIAPSSDAQPIDDAELRRLQTLLEACWGKFDDTIAEAAGKPLSKGPRGGGRELDEIARHVAEVEVAYLRRLGWKPEAGQANGVSKIRQAALNALAVAARGEGPSSGPRGGKLWIPRYYVRRTAWHVLDHAWEIEDRVISA
jgi:hypothetical protein